MRNTIAITSLFFLMLLYACTQSSTPTDNVKAEKISYLEVGKSYAMRTGAVLMSNLTNAIAQNGAESAISFCNERASTLTDSVARSLNAKIKRVSDKNRNPNNLANKDELAFILNAKSLMQKGEKPKPQITEAGGKVLGYYPIITNSMCLQCHGKIDTDILPGTLAKLNERYPNDKATGYGANELRGIWVVEMQ